MDVPCTPENIRRSKLTRSQSAQPEEWTLSSSPYSVRQKPKSPGRSLTAIFTRTKRTERAASEDHVNRRRTIGTHFSTVRGFDSMQNLEEMPMDISLPEIDCYNDSISDYPNWDNFDDRNNQNFNMKAYQDNGHESMAPSSSVGTCLRKRSALPSVDNIDVTKPTLKMSSKLCSILMMFCKFIFWCSVLLIILFLALFSLSSLNVYNKKQCEQRQSFKIPLHTLRGKLKSHIIGQDIATEMLLTSLQKWENNNSREPFVMWMVGWYGSGKTHTINILKNIFPDSMQIHTFIPSILMVSSTSIQKDVQKILKKLDSCSPKMIIVDGWDEDDDVSTDIIKTIYKEFQTRSRDENSGKNILIVSGTEGSRLINREYLKHRLLKKDRQTLELSHFDNISQAIILNKKLNRIFDKLVVIPFMPLEKPQVKDCVLLELNKMLEDNSHITEYREIDKSYIFEEVLKQITFLPPGQPLLSATGCKRVQPLLRVLLLEDK